MLINAGHISKEEKSWLIIAGQIPKEEYRIFIGAD